MKSTFFRRYLTKFTKRAKSSIVLVSGLCFAFSPFSASADQASDIMGIKGTLEILNEWIQADQYQFLQDWKEDELTALQDIVPLKFQNRVLQSLVGRGVNDSFSYSDTDNIRAYLEALTRGVYGTSSQTSNPLPGSLLDYQKNQLSRLTQALALLQALTNSSSSASTSPDILAGNPWWATNSAFALTQRDYSRVYPNEYPNNAGTFSFPQFLSQWSGFLTYPNSSSGNTINLASLRNGWHNYFGIASRTWDANSAKPYTWFDWMSDAMRSNWVSQATEQRTLEAILSASLNVGSTNVVNVFVTNIVGGVTNILNAPDILAGNPWWATNSGFQTEWTGYNTYHPYPVSGYLYSFPEFASVQSATRIRALQLLPDLYNAFGLSRPFLSGYGVNSDQGLYTFEDWIADFLKSNLVLTTSSHATNIEDELYQAGYEVDQTITNVPLPEYSLPSNESIPEAESALASGESAINDLIDNLPKPSTGGNAEIVVIPEFTVGGIHVREYRASLNSSIVPVCRSVLSFLYAVGVACFIFTTAKGEYLFYASLGRMWGSHGYDPSAS